MFTGGIPDIALHSTSPKHCMYIYVFIYRERATGPERTHSGPTAVGPCTGQTKQSLLLCFVKAQHKCNSKYLIAVTRNSSDPLQTATTNTQNYQDSHRNERKKTEVVQTTATPPNLKEKELKYQVY